MDGRTTIAKSPEALPFGTRLSREALTIGVKCAQLAGVGGFNFWRHTVRRLPRFLAAARDRLVRDDIATPPQPGL